MPRLAGIGMVVVIAAGGLGLVYAHSARQTPPASRRGAPAVHSHAALSARVVGQQTVGLVDFGPYDDRDSWANDPDDHPLMLRPATAGVEFVRIPPSELTSGVPQWTADQMADGSDVFIYIPTGQCLSTGPGAGPGTTGLTLRHCALELSQRWRPVRRATVAGEALSAFASAQTGRCLTAPRRAGPAFLAPCGPVRTKNQEIAFWWNP